ncbi:MAG: hypothetical protein AAFW81_07670 [Pseudomonadota bacterium]
MKQAKDLVEPMQNQPRAQSLIARTSDVISFWGVILVSALAIAAIAIATPIVLLISAAAGAIGGDKPRTTWRAARA